MDGTGRVEYEACRQQPASEGCYAQRRQQLNAMISIPVHNAAKLHHPRPLRCDFSSILQPKFEVFTLIFIKTCRNTEFYH